MKKKLNSVLLVDDNESDNFLHRKVIEKAGIADRIDFAVNGKEALDFILTARQGSPSDASYYQPELIFLDINMPVMDGWEFLEEYQKLEDDQKKGVVIMMVTTSLNPGDLIKAEKMIGRDCYHYKPLTLNAINEIMRKNFPEYL